MSAMAHVLPFVKGHGTLNDFVVVDDPDGELDLSAVQVVTLCDRRGGVGADGVLRVVRGRHVPEWEGDPSTWFMDYRNADGSIAEMCGNGLRVFARYLREAGHVSAACREVSVGTRAGLRTASYVGDEVRIALGRPRVQLNAVEVFVGAGRWPAAQVDVGNPHAVAVVDRGGLSDLRLSDAPQWTPQHAFPQGVNVEFVEELGPDEARMRVYERGVGETMSCGTGTVAVAATLAARAERSEASYLIHIPGGTVRVDLADGEAYLTGPAQLTFAGTFTLDTEGEQLG